MTYFTLTAL